MDLFPSSGERGEKTLTQLGPLERANINHWMKMFGEIKMVGRSRGIF
jgi:hypothetical protein